MSTLHLNAKDYWNKEMNQWNVNDWDIYILKQDPKITKMQSHKLLSAELKRMKLKFTSDHPVYQRIEKIQYMLKRIQKDKFNLRIWRDLKEMNEKKGKLERKRNLFATPNFERNPAPLTSPGFR